MSRTNRRTNEKNQSGKYNNWFWSTYYWKFEEFDRPSKFHRDGYWTETSASTGFKKDSNRLLRLNRKRMAKKVHDGTDVDELEWYTKKNGKRIAWDYW